MVKSRLLLDADLMNLAASDAPLAWSEKMPFMADFDSGWTRVKIRKFFPACCCVVARPFGWYVFKDTESFYAWYSDLHLEK